jgi:hypothetical protein
VAKVKPLLFRYGHQGRPRVKMVRSQRDNDCGVCAVANLLGCSWGWAADLIFGYWYNRRSFATKTKDIVAVISRMVIASRPAPKLIRVNQWRDIPDGSIVKVIPGPCEGTGDWHWVVWRDGLIWDSLNTTPVKPARYGLRYGRRLVSYIGLTP